MKAIIQIDVPDHQIGQEASIYFKDTMMIKGIAQEPSGDLISRQAVLDILEREGHKWGNDYRDWVDAINEVETLSPVNPQEPKTGHWTHDGSHWKNRFICSECGYKLFGEPTNYCPNCGCRMVEPQESEDDE